MAAFHEVMKTLSDEDFGKQIREVSDLGYNNMLCEDVTKPLSRDTGAYCDQEVPKDGGHHR